MTYGHPYTFAIGTVWIYADQQHITGISFGQQAGVVLQQTPLIKVAAEQLTEYFERKRQQFDLPLKPVGTPFQQAVWQALCDIPYGQTRSYKQIAQAVGNPKGCRAVGMANNRNPLMIVVPCHRVVGANGNMVGYDGGVDKKIILLDLERGA